MHQIWLKFFFTVTNTSGLINIFFLPGNQEKINDTECKKFSSYIMYSHSVVVILICKFQEIKAYWQTITGTLGINAIVAIPNNLIP